MTYLTRLIGSWRRRIIFVTLVSLFLTAYLLSGFVSDRGANGVNVHLNQADAHRLHPIDHLHKLWTTEHTRVVARQSHTIDEAVSEYTRRYHRHPPRQFDVWFRYATSKNYSLIDEFDALENILRPYRTISPSTLRQRIQSIKDDQRLAHLNVQSSTVHKSGRIHPRVDWIAKLVTDYVEFGLDFEGLELILNLNDEPMVIETNVEDTHVTVDTLSFHDYSKQPVWLEQSDACQSRDAPMTESITEGQPLFEGETIAFLNGSPSMQQDFCWTPNLGRQHALFISPMSLLVTSVLVPIFSQARPRGFQDLLFPSPAYFMEEIHEEDGSAKETMDDYQGRYSLEPTVLTDNGHASWQALVNQVYWAGGSTGGWNTVSNWKAMHRTRIAALPKGSTPVGISTWYEGATQTLHTKDDNFPEPAVVSRRDMVQNMSIAATESSPSKPVQTDERNEVGLSTKLPTMKTVSFKSLSRLFALSVTEPRQCTQLACTLIRLRFQSIWSLFIPSLRDLKHAWNTSHAYKYVLDLDGNSFSGRFRRLLLSPSAVVKATIFQEWHEDLLTPWVHYFPLSMSANELGEMARFLIEDERGRRIGEEVATASTAYAARSLRREDAHVWFLRCLIEYHDMMEGV